MPHLPPNTPGDALGDTIKIQHPRITEQFNNADIQSTHKDHKKVASWCNIDTGSMMSQITTVTANPASLV